MTKNLRRKLLRDLKQNFTQFLAIFAMCFLAMVVMETFDSDLTGTTNSVDEYYRDTNFADMQIESEAFTADDLIAVRSLPDVKNAVLRSTSAGRIKLAGGEKKLEFNFIDDDSISGMLLMEGEPFGSGKSGIWMDRNFAALQGIAIGDRLQLVCDGVEFDEEVKGIVDNPEHLYFIIDDTYTDPAIGEYGFAFLDSGEYPGPVLLYDRMFLDIRGVDSQYFITDEESELIDRVKPEIIRVLAKSDIGFVPKDKEAGFESLKGDMDSDEILSIVFPFLFIIIALLGIMTTMTRLVMKQRTIIGTLKALGFSSGAVMLHYVSYSVIVALVGGTLGAVTGWWTIGKYIHRSMAEFYSNPYERMQLSAKVVITIIGMAVMAGMTNFLACRKLLLQRASDILRPEPPAVVGAGILEKTPVWNKLSFATRWNLRDINRNRLRTLGALAGVLLCSVLLLTAFGANELLKFTDTWEYYELTPAATTINFSSDAGYGTVYDYSRLFSGQMVQNTGVELTGKEVTKTYNLMVPGDGNLVRFQDNDGIYTPLPDGGIAISHRAAEELELGVGDFVSFKLPGDRRAYRGRIEMIYKTPYTQGIAMKRAYYESLGAQFTPTLVYTDMTVPMSYAAERPEITSIFLKDAYIKSLLARRAVMDTEVLYIMIVAVTLGIVVMYNLGTMSFMEKVREIATLKVLGFPTNRIRWILQQQNIAITGMGTLAGLCIGSKLLVFMMRQLDADSDFLYKRMSIMPYILAFMLSFVFSVVVNGIISAKVKDIDMVEALKGVE